METTMHHLFIPRILAMSVMCSAVLMAAENLSVRSALPAREITVFKDGHALVMARDRVNIGADGTVQLEHESSPVLGTFWPFVADPELRLRSTISGIRQVTTSRTPVTMAEMISAHPGAQVVISEIGSTPYEATIISLLQRSAEEAVPHDHRMHTMTQPQTGPMVLLRRSHGVRAVPLSRIQDVTFLEMPERSIVDHQMRPVLTMRLERQGQPAQGETEVGLLYLQRGLRWIPQYLVDIDGEGTARLRLQATLINELVDFSDVRLRLVIGAPEFRFKDSVDPMAAEQIGVRLSHFFRDADPRTAHMLSNAIMTQTARMGEVRHHSGAASGDAGPGLPSDLSGESVEDLHVFTLEGLSMRRGERMVVSLAETEISYQDVYTLHLPWTLPSDIRNAMGHRQGNELAQLLAAPKVMHQLRLTNRSAHPFTTAPAVIMRDGQLLGQAMMTYTARGATVDLAVAAAVDVQLRVTDLETGREADSRAWERRNLMRVDYSGSIVLTNHRPQAISIEVVRPVLGHVTTASADGIIEKPADAQTWSEHDLPAWWSWWNRPAWWTRFNGLNRIRWATEIGPGQNLTLGYDWHYLWL